MDPYGGECYCGDDSGVAAGVVVWGKQQHRWVLANRTPKNINRFACARCLLVEVIS